MADSIDNYAYKHGLPCRNPNCSSKGKPHPHCHCYGGGGEGDYAKGSVICMGPHKPDCIYFLDGGQVPQADLHTTVGHAAAHHGLLGMMTEVGRPKMADPEKHYKTLDKAKIHMTMGDHEKATDLLHGHPLAGSSAKSHLKEILGHLQPSIMANESNPEALRGSIDYMHSAVKGHNQIKDHASKMLGADKMPMDAPDTEKLKDFLSDVEANPEKLLDVSGNIGHYQPDQAAGIGAMAATATQYLNSIKPKSQQASPLDEVTPPSKPQMAGWNRQLEIAEHPSLVLRHIKDGTLLPQDLDTVKTIYPGLHQSMVEQATNALIEAKTKNKEIPHKQKQALSQLLGQPLSFTQTPQAMQAIIHSAAPQQAQNQKKAQSGPKKASNTELSQINKVNEMSETPLQARQINRNKS